MKKSIPLLVSVMLLIEACSYGFWMKPERCIPITSSKGDTVTRWHSEHFIMLLETAADIYANLVYDGYDGAGNLLFTRKVRGYRFYGYTAGHGSESTQFTIPARVGAEIDRKELGDVFSLRVIAIDGDILTSMLVPREGCPDA